MANAGDAVSQAKNVEATKSADSHVPAGAHIFTPGDVCPNVFQRNPKDDASTVALLGLPTSEQLMKWVMPDGKDNPPQDTWRHDSNGHVIQAGDKFQATYDKNGDLVSATMGDERYTKTGKDQVTETYKGNDGKDHQDVTNGVIDFSAKPWSEQWHGGAAGMEIKVSFGSGSSKSDSSMLYEDAAHQVTDYSFRASEKACEAQAKEK